MRPPLDFTILNSNFITPSKNHHISETTKKYLDKSTHTTSHKYIIYLQYSEIPKIHQNQPVIAISTTITAIVPQIIHNQPITFTQSYSVYNLYHLKKNTCTNSWNLHLYIQSFSFQLSSNSVLLTLQEGPLHHGQQCKVNFAAFNRY